MHILYYGGKNKQKRRQVEALLQQQALSYTIIHMQQGNATVNDLLMHNDTVSSPCMLPDMELMIFHEASDEAISEISESLKAAKLSVPYKCVVTKHNRTWKLNALCHEIMEEHAYFTAYEACRKRVMEVADLREADYQRATWKQYEAAFMQAYLLLQDEQCTTTLLKQASKAIDEAKAKLIKG